jgi:crotonobetainyl-CoA:carnitine CoA-transferase CaiB-like acyl-CoA transferase
MTTSDPGTARNGGALAGITVLEVASYVSGPFAGMLLSDLGADVIKIEPPGAGDPFRGWGKSDYSATFGSLNRNKKSVVLDLKTQDGADMLRRLARRADVLLENYRPGTMERMKLGYDDLRRLNERLIYCSITGFGSEGPYRDYPGYDTVGQGMGGLLSLLTEKLAPRPMGISLSDHLTGMFACYGILAAVVARQRTGRGQLVETSLLEATVAFLAENAANFFEGGPPPDRARRTHQALVFAFVARDQRPFVIHLSSPPKFWDGLTKAIGRIDLRADVRFHDRAARSANYDALDGLLAEIFQTRDRDDWLALLRAEDVPCGPLSDLQEVFDDPQVKLLGLRRELPHARRGRVSVVGSAVRMSDTPVQIVRAAPELGDDTEEVLGTILK